jgi:SsrA-binding protein
MVWFFSGCQDREEGGNTMTDELSVGLTTLLHKAEIERLEQRTKESGLTLVPLQLYFSGSHVKVELALAKGKRSYDKRQDLAKRDADREITRALGRRSKGMG